PNLKVLNLVKSKSHNPHNLKPVNIEQTHADNH
ncbi:uncharacterized protein METZ01_LOCUS238714, partial [marine metagenome]